MTLAYKFAPGDKVVYTNEFGVCWGVKTIKSLDVWEDGLPRYYIEPTETPWCSVAERNLVSADAEDLIMDLWGFDRKRAYFQEKYGWPTPQEDLDALLDGDPLEGESMLYIKPLYGRGESE
jgi:hypothetical protein